MTNLLTDHPITTTTTSGPEAHSLPETLAACITDQIEDFTHLRPFQEHPWHAFLTQLGAIAMVKADLTTPPDTPAGWYAALESLTRDSFPEQEPWTLVVDDLQLPAFMQPPPGDPKFLSKYPSSPTPDSIDLTIGSRRHDVKDGVATAPSDDHWIYALISIQTAQGYSGPYLQRISRINQAYGNRHAFSITPSTRWGRHITRDMTILATQFAGADVDNLLLWTYPWTGLKGDTISLDDLHPWPIYIEVCRRLRLHTDEAGVIRATRGTSRSKRIDDQDRLGEVQDPWQLYQENKVTTISERGFTCRATTAYLNPERNTLPLLARHHPETDGDSPMFLVARALSRGRGKTHGYHTMTIPISNEFAAMLDSGHRQERLAKAAEARIAIIADLQRIFTGSLRAYSAAPADAAFSWSNKLEHAAAADFWHCLQEELASEDPDQQRMLWTQDKLIPRATAILQDARSSLSTIHHVRYTALTRSNDIFYGQLRNSKVIPQRPRPDATEGKATSTKKEKMPA